MLWYIEESGRNTATLMKSSARVYSSLREMSRSEDQLLSIRLITLFFLDKEKKKNRVNQELNANKS